MEIIIIIIIIIIITIIIIIEHDMVYIYNNVTIRTSNIDVKIRTYIQIINLSP